VQFRRERRGRKKRKRKTKEEKRRQGKIKIALGCQEEIIGCKGQNRKSWN
jgi:hypothetical protein